MAVRSAHDSLYAALSSTKELLEPCSRHVGLQVERAIDRYNLNVVTEVNS